MIKRIKFKTVSSEYKRMCMKTGAPCNPTCPENYTVGGCPYLFICLTSCSEPLNFGDLNGEDDKTKNFNVQISY